ncbi:MAG TPA: CGNR zinc finger domain-containing protein [Candidatus Limnocylindrales bacterium]|nr:CGNR zinc finger domain-containing protein [Candidatus Limnocylindrales bacterium]
MSRIGPGEPGVLDLTPRRSLTDLLWVANTRHGPGGHWFARVVEDTADHDHLVRAEQAVKYLADHKVILPGERLTARHTRALEAIREMVRGLLEPDRGWTPAVRTILAGTRFEVDEDRRLAASGTGWEAFISDLLVPLIQLIELRDRLRICANPHCRLVFLDLSKNQARQWCDNGGCGNRDRVQRYRTRRKASEAYSPR